MTLPRREPTFKVDKPLVALIIVCVMLRVVFLLVYQPATFPDTQDYINTGREFQTLDFENYTAVRTPVFPLLMAATGFNPWGIWLVQSAMGLAITIMLYLMARYHVADIRIAFVIGLSYSLTINLLFFEAALMTETLSTFLLMLTLFFFILSRRSEGRMIFYVALGLTVSLAVLTRPVMLLLGPIYLLFLIVRWTRQRYDAGRWAGYLAGFGIPIAVLLGGYIIFNGMYAGSFTLSPLTGYNLAGHSGAFMEYAPDEYATIRDIYLKYREARIADTGTHFWTIWDADAELRRVTGLDFVELNNVLAKLSLKLIAEQPLLYLQNAAKAWANFWASSIVWHLDYWSAPIVQTILYGLWWTVRWLLIFINLAFLAIGLYSLRERRRENRLLDYDAEFHWLVLTLVLSTSLLQALVIYADNWRFSVPYQPLITYVVVVWLWLFGLRWERRRAPH